jgi:hypothetical protein
MRELCIVNVVNSDVLKHIVKFLDNQTIIQVLITSKKINNMLRYKKKYQNLFTSISVHPEADLFSYIHHYINHSVSIQKTVLYRMVEPHIMWPFSSKEMVYVNCRFEEGYQKHTNKYITYIS